MFIVAEGDWRACPWLSGVLKVLSALPLQWYEKNYNIYGRKGSTV